MASGWKVTLPCTLAEAEAVDADALIGLEPPPVVMASEADEGWRLDVYFEDKPSARALKAVAALAPSTTAKPIVEALPDADWVTMSQAGLEPVFAGRFVVHAGADAPATPPRGRAFRIDAGLAFGTGQHATTTGCMIMLDACRRRGAVFRDVVDLGTGTGLLAFARAPFVAECAVDRDRHRSGRGAGGRRERIAQRRAARPPARRRRPPRRRRHGAPTTRPARAVRPCHRQHPRRPAD